MRMPQVKHFGQAINGFKFMMKSYLTQKPPVLVRSDSLEHTGRLSTAHWCSLNSTLVQSQQPTGALSTAHLVELLYHFLLRLSTGLPLGKPVVKRLSRGKDLRQQEVEQSPQLVQVVLERRASDQQPVVGLEHAHRLQIHRTCFTCLSRKWPDSR